MGLDEAIARYALGLAGAEDFVAAASELLDSGISSDDVCCLAGLTKPLLFRDAEPLFKAILVKLGKKIPEKEEAALYLATGYARGIVSGEIDSVAGILAIAPLWMWGGRPKLLNGLFGLSDGVDELLTAFDQASGDLKSRKESQLSKLRQMIIAEAKNFLSKVGSTS